MLFRMPRTYSILLLTTLVLFGSAAGENSSGKPVKRIVDGKAISKDDVGFVVSLEVPVASGTKYCAGTIFAENRVITSATCFMDDKTLEVKKDMEIKVGYYENEISKQEKFATKDYYVHDEFSVSKDGVVNNIAVVELKDGPLTDSEKMANLFSMENIWPGIAMTTYGWGTGEPVSFDNSGNNRTDALRMGLVMTGDLDFCKERIDGFVDHNESGICVMFNAKLPNAICSGDAGTGLYFSDENKKQVLVAISSFVVGEKGKLCGKSDSVTYFTKVDDYTEFIFKKR